MELPKSHIRDLLRSNHDVLIGSDAIDAVNEIIQKLKIQVNAEIHNIMQNEGRTIIKEEQILKAIHNIGLNDSRHFDNLRLTKADMRRFLKDPETNYMISEESVIKMQHIMEVFLRTMGDKAFKYLQKKNRKTINKEAVSLAYKGILENQNITVEISPKTNKKKTKKKIKPDKSQSNNDEIEKRLWEAADQLRANSGLKYSQFSRPILGLIFLKYADYKFTQAQEELEVAPKGEPKQGTIDAYIPIRKKITPSDYQAKGVIYIPKNAQYSYIIDLPESENIGKALNNAMRAIEKANDDLRGVLDIEYGEIEDSILFALLKLFSQIDFRYNDDIFGKIYEYFLGNFAMGEGQRGGEFFTPESLVKLIVEIIEPKKGRIYDPACGSGGMFVQSANFIRKFGENPMNNISVYGQEKVLENVKLCKMNLAVHGISGEILQGNTYYDDLHKSYNKFDFVMSNPPFNVNGVDKEKIKTDSKFKFGIPSVDNANYLWIQIFLNSLNENGRAGFVMTSSAADMGQSELKIRKKLIMTNFIDVIISIAPKFFYNVSLPCTLWFFDKSKINLERKDKILFIDATKIYTGIDRAHRCFSLDQIEFIDSIVRLYRGDNKNHIGKSKLVKQNFPKLKYRDNLGLCKVVDLKEISEMRYSLNPEKYVGVKKENIVNIDFFKTLKELKKRFKILNQKSREYESKLLEKIELIIQDNNNAEKQLERSND